MNLPRDPGLQAERTALSWNRTGLAVLGNALLALREGWHGQHGTVSVLACVMLVAAAAAVFYGAWRRQQLLNCKTPVAVSAQAIATASIISLMACGAVVVHLGVVAARLL
ncbi:hypothetical protein DM813_18295 [Pseudomonas alkylphenolica]|uniref:DUF202 domain-containing protein n=1 Tax=Pseudomonas alkylphenolica TaxID=237609 RepID=A0A443ZPV7_9PSED|nr:DUF202 domain-containing protein [Pseudomonas alkylphenolica]RWU21151.1 hypothetical protein DM813_18295 [Pseudomonas alkylphenolica]